MTPDDDYDPAKDSHDSYFAAIEAKRLRGDAAGPAPSSEAPPSGLPAISPTRRETGSSAVTARRMGALGAAIEAEIERQEARADGRD